MQCYVGGRRTGKTTSLIRLSHDTGFPIVCRTQEMAWAIEWQALRMGTEIPVPICYKNQAVAVGALRERRVLVDEAQGVLSEMLGRDVVAASIDGEALRLANPAIGSMKFLDLLRLWRSERKERNGQ